MKKVFYIVSFSFMLMGCSSPKPTVLKPDYSKPVVVDGCEEAKEDKTRKVDC